MQVTILGCGSSHGVPSLNCDCFVCKSENIKNKRKRKKINKENKKYDTVKHIFLQRIESEKKKCKHEQFQKI